MDSWEWNKIAGAVLGALLFVLVVKLVADALYQAPMPKRPGYVVDVPPPQAQAVAEPVPDFSDVLYAADVNNGREVASRCVECHSLTKTGTNKIGPNLWGIVGRARASFADYNYSNAMAVSHDPWTYERLFAFLRAPQSAVAGTKMSFTGIYSPQDRVDLLAYLRTLGDTPAPIPEQK